ncbi:hypothetical protein NHX12_033316 [Muraenolepis orangiensis]|uniref:Uncharacterized protein n=1 Tax=Muraenolepis orangiensis TaxID=630683 RepID=A0A9Q0IIL1_9TELE|nr:hypothetical protein NHX12_033316 [Muraenolepis orangiensis]
MLYYYSKGNPRTVGRCGDTAVSEARVVCCSSRVPPTEGPPPGAPGLSGGALSWAERSRRAPGGTRPMKDDTSRGERRETRRQERDWERHRRRGEKPGERREEREQERGEGRETRRDTGEERNQERGGTPGERREEREQERGEGRETRRDTGEERNQERGEPPGERRETRREERGERRESGIDTGEEDTQDSAGQSEGYLCGPGELQRGPAAEHQMLQSWFSGDRIDEEGSEDASFLLAFLRRSTSSLLRSPAIHTASSVAATPPEPLAQVTSTRRAQQRETVLQSPETSRALRPPEP